MGQETKKQHFTPEFHIAQFADPSDNQGQTWTFAAHHPEWPPKMRAPSSVCWQHDLYSVRGCPGANSMLLEHGFRDFETMAADVVKTLVAHADSVYSISPREAFILKEYVASLIIRNPLYLHFRRPAVAAEVDAELRDSVSSLARQLCTLLDPSKECLIPEYVTQLDLNEFVHDGAVAKDGQWRLVPETIRRDLPPVVAMFRTFAATVVSIDPQDPQFFLPDMPVWLGGRFPDYVWTATPLSPRTVLLVGSASAEQLIADFSRLDFHAQLAAMTNKYCYAAQPDPKIIAILKEQKLRRRPPIDHRNL